MTYSTEQFVETSKANFRAQEELTSHVLAGIEKLAELNLTESKAIVADSFRHVESVLGAKDAQVILNLQSGLFKPLADKTATYGRQLYTLLSGTGAEVTKAFEARASEVQGAFAGVLASFEKNAPAGTEATVAALKSAIAGGQNIIESAQNSARKAVAVAESSFVAATSQAVDVASKTSRKK